MALLILGLALFLGIHCTHIFAPSWRQNQIARIGGGPWKGLYTVVSSLGFGLIIWGFGQARLDPQPLWTPPVWTRHLSALLVLLSFVLLAAAYVPGNHFKQKIGHPMVASVKLWALAHLLANGNVAHVVLFGSFLIWAVLCFKSLRSRDRAAGQVYPAGTLIADVITVVAGAAAWAGFAFWAHGWLIGVRPFG